MRCFRFPPPMVRVPEPRDCCCGLVASDYRIADPHCGIWPTIDRNMAVLKSLGAAVIDGVDARTVNVLFPDAALVVWASPHGNVASSKAPRGAAGIPWCNNDAFNLEAFHMLQALLPEATVLVPFPGHYQQAAQSSDCRPVILPCQGSVVYEPLSSNAMLYERLCLTSSVRCLASDDVGEEVDIVALVTSRLKVVGSVVGLHPWARVDESVFDFAGALLVLTGGLMFQTTVNGI